MLMGVVLDGDPMTSGLSTKLRINLLPTYVRPIASWQLHAPRTRR